MAASSALPRWCVKSKVRQAFNLTILSLVTRSRITAAPPGGVVITGKARLGTDVVVDFKRQITTTNRGLEAFHHGFFVSKVLRLQRRGIATHMLSQCLPYYKSLGIKIVTIPMPIGPGITVWPKFGFVLIKDFQAEYLDQVRDIYARETDGRPLPTASIPLGPGFDEYEEVETPGLALAALREMGTRIYELDLGDPAALRCLRKRNIVI